MDPDSNKTPSLPNMQGVYGPTPPSDVQSPSFQPPKPLKSSKRKFVIVGVVVVGLVILIAVLFNLPQTPKKQPQTQDTDTHTEAQGPRPATAVTTEQDNNAVSQEIGNPNDDRDFPADQLSDDNLEL